MASKLIRWREAAAQHDLFPSLFFPPNHLSLSTSLTVTHTLYVIKIWRKIIVIVCKNKGGGVAQKESRNSFSLSLQTI